MPTKEQHVFSGLKRVVVPFTVVNDDDEFLRNVKVHVEPTIATATVHALESHSPLEGESLQIRRYEVWIEGAIALSDTSTDYRLAITGVNGTTSPCTDTDNTHLVRVYPAELKNRSVIEAILARMVYIGRPLRLRPEPNARMIIPWSQFEGTFILHSKDSISVLTQQGLTPTVPCISSNIDSVNFKTEWIYAPDHTSYVEKLLLFQQTSSEARQQSPDVISANTSHFWDSRRHRLILSGIIVNPPRRDCGITADEKDLLLEVQTDWYSGNGFRLLATLEREGELTYRVVLNVLPDSATMALANRKHIKYRGADVAVTLTCTYNGASETEQIRGIVPEFAVESIDRDRESGSWRARLQKQFNLPNGDISVYRMSQQSNDSLNALLHPRPTLKPAIINAVSKLLGSNVVGSPEYQEIGYILSRGVTSIQKVIDKMDEEGVFDESVLKSKEFADFVGYMIDDHLYKSREWARESYIIVNQKRKSSGKNEESIVGLFSAYQTTTLPNAFYVSDIKRCIINASTLDLLDGTKINPNTKTLKQYLARLIESGSAVDVTAEAKQ
jgi:hypothetical protein